MFGNSVLRTKLAHANILQTKQAKTGPIRDHIRTDNQVPTIAKKPRKWYAPHMVDNGNIINLSYDEYFYV